MDKNLIFDLHRKLWNHSRNCHSKKQRKNHEKQSRKFSSVMEFALEIVAIDWVVGRLVNWLPLKLLANSRLENATIYNFIWVHWLADIVVLPVVSPSCYCQHENMASLNEFGQLHLPLICCSKCSSKQSADCNTIVGKPPKGLGYEKIWENSRDCWEI